MSPSSTCNLVCLVMSTGSVGDGLEEKFFGKNGDQRLTVDKFKDFHMQLLEEVMKLEVRQHPVTGGGGGGGGGGGRPLCMCWPPQLYFCSTAKTREKKERITS